MSARALLEVQGLSKSYPGVKAADAISFAVAPGEIHALLGENGAGKSTLVKMIYGAVRPDSGRMLLDGQPFQPQKPADARSHGIGMVFQHFSLFEAMTATENVALGLDGAVANDELASRIVSVSKTYGLGMDPDRIVGELSVGERQRIEIVRCLLQSPRLLIMDEPTSVLTPHEATELFVTLRTLAQDGCAILYISHKLEEIRALCHSATILRGGKVVGTCVPKDQTAKALAEMMIGTGLVAPTRVRIPPGEVRVKVSDLTMPANRPFGQALDGISFEVQAGEILGIAGVAGNGQNELVEALGGERLADRAEQIIFDRAAIGRLDAAERRRRGVAFLPEERLGHGAVPDASLVENMLLSQRLRVSDLGFVAWSDVRSDAEDVIARFDVKTPGPEKAARGLSGGNLQKFVIGREIAANPGMFIACQPTWGVDAGAAAEIHKAIIRLAEAGTAVILISQDLDELFAVSTHLAVIARGHLGPVVRIEDATVEDIGRQMEGKPQVRADNAATERAHV